MPGSFPKAIHKGFKMTSCPVQKAAARKEKTPGSMSVKSAVNAGKVNWPTVTAWDKISPKWPLNKENVLLTLISWHPSILSSRKITKKRSLSTSTLRIKPNFLTSFFPGTGGFWLSLKTYCTESTVVWLYPTGTGAKKRITMSLTTWSVVPW